MTYIGYRFSFILGDILPHLTGILPCYLHGPCGEEDCGRSEEEREIVRYLQVLCIETLANIPQWVTQGCGAHLPPVAIFDATIWWLMVLLANRGLGEMIIVTPLVTHCDIGDNKNVDIERRYTWTLILWYWEIINVTPRYNTLWYWPPINTMCILPVHGEGRVEGVRCVESHWYSAPSRNCESPWRESRVARAPPWTPGSRDDDAWKSTVYTLQSTEYSLQRQSTVYSLQSTVYSLQSTE